MDAPSNPYHTCDKCGKNVKDLRGHWKRMHAPPPPKPVVKPVAEPVPEPPKAASPSYDEEFDEYLESILTTGEAPMPPGGWEPVPLPTYPNKGWQGTMPPPEPAGGAGAPSFAMVAAASKPPPKVETAFVIGTNDRNVERVVNSLMRNARPMRTHPVPACWMLLQHVWPTTQKMINGLHGDASDPYFSAKVCLQRDGGDKFGMVSMFVTLHLHVRTRTDGFYVATHASLRTTNGGNVHDQGITFEQPYAYNGA